MEHEGEGRTLSPVQDLRVDLSTFQGPLDLLLHLVQQEEVEIQDIPLARIADRFLEACRGRVGSLDVDRPGAGAGGGSGAAR